MNNPLISQAKKRMFLSFFCCKNGIHFKENDYSNEETVKNREVCEKIS